MQKLRNVKSSGSYTYTAKPRAVGRETPINDDDDICTARPVSRMQREPDPHLGRTGMLPIKYRLSDILQEAAELGDSDEEEDDLEMSAVEALPGQLSNEELDLMLAAVDDDLQDLEVGWEDMSCLQTEVKDLRDHLESRAGNRPQDAMELPPMMCKAATQRNAALDMGSKLFGSDDEDSPV